MDKKSQHQKVVHIVGFGYSQSMKRKTEILILTCLKVYINENQSPITQYKETTFVIFYTFG